jgi:hypothetical protein
MSLLSRAVAKIKDALVFLSQNAGIGQENQIMEVIHDQVRAGMRPDRGFAAFVIFCAPAPAAPPFSAAGHCHAPGHALTSNLTPLWGPNAKKLALSICRRV